MPFLNKLLRPSSIPFYKKNGNEKYAELLKFKGIPECANFSTKRILQEIHSQNESVVSKLDCDLAYLHIDKYGRVQKFDLAKTKFERSTKKLFERCDGNLPDIMALDIPNGKFINEDGVRLTFISDKGNFSITGTPMELDKQKIFGQTLTHFLNLVEMTNPKGFNK